MLKHGFSSSYSMLCLGLFLALASANSAVAADLQLKAKLVWGTDSDKPEDRGLKELDPKLTERLKGVFKWKNYFEVREQKFSVPPGGPKKVEMSKKCEIEVQNLQKGGVEVKLFGEGKLLKTVKQVIPPGELLVLAGDDKNKTAWFVVLTTQTP
jgi:hypothetical protein